VLGEYRVVEQRYDAVMEVLRDGQTVTEVAERWGSGLELTVGSSVIVSRRRAGRSATLGAIPGDDPGHPADAPAASPGRPCTL
jgi:hypothetical protein